MSLLLLIVVSSLTTCESFCSSFEFECTYDGTCIDDSDYCDGFDDCLFGSDEPYFSSHKCWWNDRCIDWPADFCDGVDDCGNCEDEPSSCTPPTACCVSGEFICDCPPSTYQCPTLTPTVVPTTVPTNIPTETPTKHPTEIPTLTPTKPPTEIPTNYPSVSPSNQPSMVPTERTMDPTMNPTINPTMNPTMNPTSTTINPTASTINPTATTINPTASTINPTATTINPTASTINPTIIPTDSTINPSINPSENPTKVTKHPTFNPVQTPIVIDQEIIISTEFSKTDEQNADENNHGVSTQTTFITISVFAVVFVTLCMVSCVALVIYKKKSKASSLQANVSKHTVTEMCDIGQIESPKNLTNTDNLSATTSSAGIIDGKKNSNDGVQTNIVESEGCTKGYNGDGNKTDVFESQSDDELYQETDKNEDSEDIYDAQDQIVTNGNTTGQ